MPPVVLQGVSIWYLSLFLLLPPYVPGLHLWRLPRGGRRADHLPPGAIRGEDVSNGKKKKMCQNVILFYQKNAFKKKEKLSLFRRSILDKICNVPSSNTLPFPHIFTTLIYYVCFFYLACPTTAPAGSRDRQVDPAGPRRRGRPLLHGRHPHHIGRMMFGFFCFFVSVFLSVPQIKNNKKHRSWTSFLTHNCHSRVGGEKKKQN